MDKLYDGNITDQDKLVLIYPGLIGEINRYRDWPIRILTFTSALHFAVIGAFLLKTIHIVTWGKCALSTFLLLLLIWTWAYFAKCHIHYLTARNTQAMIQKKLQLDKWRVDDSAVFPQESFLHTKVSISNRWWGWGFYAFYATGLTLASIAAVWGIIAT